MLKKRKLLSPLTILMIIIIIGAIITWLVPAGRFDTLKYTNGQFEYSHDGENIMLEASQSVLDSLKVSIPLASFQNGSIKKPIGVPGTFHEIESNHQGLLDILQAPIKGTLDAIDIILFVLIIGAFINVFHSTGAMTRGLKTLSRRMKGRETWLIIILTFLFALGGASFGMAEETLAFYPIIVPLFLGAGFDLILPVAVLFGGTHLGTLTSVTNPFSTIIASDAAGIVWTDGLIGRIIMFVITTVLTTGYFLWYAKKVQKNPAFSYYKGAEELPMYEELSGEETKLSGRDRMLLIIFLITFLALVGGVVFLDWWLVEMSALFLAASIVIGFVNRIPEGNFIKQFLKGAEDMVGVGLIIGAARGVTVVLNDGHISDSIIYYSSQFVSTFSPSLLIVSVFFLYIIFTLFITSTSGMAVLTMPIIGGLGMMADIPTREIVNAYLYGMGVMSFMSPSGLMLPSLAMVNIDLKAWWKFIYPLMLMLSVVCIIALLIGIRLK
ncbi:MAG: YfcC family protein [Chitinophagaceae bacterium]|nr:YfcC family protein [Chitinophagaceae bacterium]